MKVEGVHRNGRRSMRKSEDRPQSSDTLFVPLSLLLTHSLTHSLSHSHHSPLSLSPQVRWTLSSRLQAAWLECPPSEAARNAKLIIRGLRVRIGIHSGVNFKSEVVFGKVRAP